GLSPHLYLSHVILLKTLLFSSSITFSNSSFFFINNCIVSLDLSLLCTCSRSYISFNNLSFLSPFFFVPIAMRFL
ncbi:unnamed protein product, partial [Staurois parvus]